jgi:hypothetical protein
MTHHISGLSVGTPHQLADALTVISEITMRKERDERTQCFLLLLASCTQIPTHSIYHF